MRAARELWDHEAWLTLATRQTGALTLLPLALNHMAGATLLTGDLDAGAALIEEAPIDHGRHREPAHVLRRGLPRRLARRRAGL
jgi:hypothetical protein